MFKLFKGHIIFFALLIVLLIGYSACTIRTSENEYTVVRQFGKVVQVNSEPGLSFKTPLIQNTLRVPKTLMLYDMAASDVITLDKKVMTADCFALWRIEDPELYLGSLGANKTNAESRIDNIVYNSLKNVVSSMNQDDVVSGRDGKLAQMILDNIGSSMESYGIRLDAIETKSLDLPEENKNAVYNRMISERDNISASFSAQGEEEYNKVKNETDLNVRVTVSKAKAEAEEIKASGESEYMRILSAAYNDESKADFYNYVRALDALKTSLKGSETTIILDRDNPLVQILNGFSVY